MAYCLRILTPQETPPSLPRLMGDLQLSWPGLRLIPEGSETRPWEQILVQLADGTDLALLCCILLDKHPVALARKKHLLEEVAQGRPVSAARWLKGYIGKVRMLYEIHPMEEVHLSHGWDILLSLRLALWEQVRGIRHTRDEGFTNPEGDLILWQYPPSATGLVPAAVYRFGRFRSFSLNLASPRHRQAFFQGKQPKP